MEVIKKAYGEISEHRTEIEAITETGTDTRMTRGIYSYEKDGKPESGSYVTYIITLQLTSRKVTHF